MQKTQALSPSYPLKGLGSVPFTRGVLLPLLADYKRPNDKIARWLASGDLLSLRRGLYLLGPLWREEPLSLPLVANVMFGPSYVSLEFALSAHGLIPENVVTITSVTTRRSRDMATPVGRFSYSHLPLQLYGLDVRFEQNIDGTSYLMASPTQALCDLLVLSRRMKSASTKAMREYLFEDLRIEPEELASLDQKVIAQCISAGRKAQQLKALLACVEGAA